MISKTNQHIPATAATPATAVRLMVITMDIGTPQNTDCDQFVRNLQPGSEDVNHQISSLDLWLDSTVIDA